MAPTEVRGLLGSVNQLVICIGILAALVVNVALPATSWRTMFYLASIPAALLALGATATLHILPGSFPPFAPLIHHVNSTYPTCIPPVPVCRGQ